MNPLIVLQTRHLELSKAIEAKFPNSTTIFCDPVVGTWQKTDMTARDVIFACLATAGNGLNTKSFQHLVEKNPRSIEILQVNPDGGEDDLPASKMKIGDKEYKTGVLNYDANTGEVVSPPSADGNGRDPEVLFPAGTVVPDSQWSKTRYAAKAAMALAGAAVVTFVALQMIAFLAPHYAAAHFSAPIQFLVTPLANALSGQAFGLMAAKIGGGSLLGAGGLFALGGGILLAKRQWEREQSDRELIL